jgi:hypothetical protein
MADKYSILLVLYDIVKNDPQPLQYHCGTRELLLRMKGDWQQEYLEELSKEKLITVKRTGTSVVVLLTEKGMEKAKLKSIVSNKD